MNQIQVPYSPDKLFVYRNITIGQGSFGTVYIGIRKQEVVAVKEVFLSPESSDQNVDPTHQSVEQNVSLLLSLKHPNVILCHEVNSKPQDNTVQLVMELSVAGDLKTALYHQFDFEYDLYTALTWMSQISTGLAYLHSFQPKKIIHRDVKLANIFLFNEGKNVKISDFGISTEDRNDIQTNCGTCYTKAPEVMMRLPYDEKVDVYSLGIIWWEMLTRKFPYPTLYSSFAIEKFVTSGGRPPAIIGIPGKFDSFLGSLWNQESNKRPTAQEAAVKFDELIKMTTGSVKSNVTDQTRRKMGIIEQLMQIVKNCASSSMVDLEKIDQLKPIIRESWPVKQVKQFNARLGEEVSRMGKDMDNEARRLDRSFSRESKKVEKEVVRAVKNTEHAVANLDIKMGKEVKKIGREVERSGKKVEKVFRKLF